MYINETIMEIINRMEILNKMQTISNHSSNIKYDSTKYSKENGLYTPEYTNNRVTTLLSKKTHWYNITTLVKYLFRKFRKKRRICDIHQPIQPPVIDGISNKYEMSNDDSIQSLEKSVHERILHKISNVTSNEKKIDETLYGIVQDIKNYRKLNNTQLDYLQKMSNSSLFEIIVLYNQMHGAIEIT